MAFTDLQHYKCASCGKEFLSEWGEEQSREELARNFPDEPVHECVIVCDQCYEVAKVVLGLK